MKFIETTFGKMVSILDKVIIHFPMGIDMF